MDDIKITCSFCGKTVALEYKYLAEKGPLYDGDCEDCETSYTVIRPGGLKE